MNALRSTLLTLLVSFVWQPGAAGADSNYVLRSPDRRIEVRIRAGGRIQYDVAVNGVVLLKDSTASINIDQVQLGRDVKVRGVKEGGVDRKIEAAVRRKSATVRDHYNELRIETENGLVVVFRAYNEGVAYRLETSLAKAQVRVYGEEAVFNFAGDYTVYYPQEESFFSHNERQYAPRKLSGIAPAAIATLPAVVDAGGIKVAIAESDVEDYPGLWLRGTSGNGLVAVFPPYPLETTLEKDRDLKVTKAAGYIAETRGTRAFPWRILGIAEKDGDLITNQLVWLLAKPSQVQDTSWIKPGKVAWDWWNANNIYGVDFKSGVNTQTYKYYIDFASMYGLEYIILDEGWYRLGNVLDVVPEINVEELVAYGRQKNVGIILWVVWKTLADQLQPALDQYEKWGVKGIKVDFMQRDDQPVVNFYHDLCREAARRKMLVDYHGAQRPALMARTWPNLISTEGVKGLEHSKWSADIDPMHTVTLPFTRMFLGPMDFTPGAMLNAAKGSFAPVFERPMSMGTRCHQLAMYVVFESPLQMLADTPSNYLREPEAMEFLGPVPTVWEETRVIDGRIAEYVVVARRRGQDWYIGAMTNWTPREFEIDLSFLPEGNLRMEAYQDGVNASRMASDYKLVKSQVNRSARLKIRLAEGGGWAARIHPQPK
ncbi:MAG: glycoside hydrolase family 97 protein [Bryobacteraceae bacterium]